MVIRSGFSAALSSLHDTSSQFKLVNIQKMLVMQRKKPQLKVTGIFLLVQEGGGLHKSLHQSAFWSSNST